MWHSVQAATRGTGLALRPRPKSDFLPRHTLKGSSDTLDEARPRWHSHCSHGPTSVGEPGRVWIPSSASGRSRPGLPRGLVLRFLWVEALFPRERKSLPFALFTFSLSLPAPSRKGNRFLWPRTTKANAKGRYGMWQNYTFHLSCTWFPNLQLYNLQCSYIGPCHPHALMCLHPGRQVLLGIEIFIMLTLINEHLVQTTLQGSVPICKRKSMSEHFLCLRGYTQSQKIAPKEK